MNKIKAYLKGCNEVYHTTLDPKGFGCVRIHLIPPKKKKLGIPWVVILNGYSLLPLQTSWAVLLKEFIVELNKTDGKELEDSDIRGLVNTTTENVKKIFTGAKQKDIKADLNEIILTLKEIARGEEPSSDIGYMTLAKYYKYMQGPHRVDLLVSSMEKDGCWNCNQKCLHCYAAGEKLGKTEELTTSEWKLIIDKLKSALVPSITFTGGEPTLRADLCELVEHAKWFVTRLNTNGILLTKSLCDSLYDASLDSVQITFYSHNEEIHNTLVGGNHFSKTVEGIKNALSSGLDVSINTPLCSINKNYLETIKFASKLGVKYFSCSGLIPTGAATKSDSIITRLSKEEITSIIKEAYNYCKSNELELSFTSPGWIDSSVLNELKMVVPSCGACLSNMAINPSGEVIPCQSWLFEESLGNILDTDFKKIWNSKKCKERRKRSSKNEILCPLSEVSK